MLQGFPQSLSSMFVSCWQEHCIAVIICCGLACCVQVDVGFSQRLESMCQDFMSRSVVIIVLNWFAWHLQVDKDLRVMLVKPDAPPPKTVDVTVWPKAIPQFNLHHLDQVQVCSVQVLSLCRPSLLPYPVYEYGLLALLIVASLFADSCLRCCSKLR